MIEFFRARCVEQYRSGPRRAVRLWLHLLADIAVNAPVLHVHALLTRTSNLAPATSADVPWSSPEYPAETRPMETLLQDIRYGARSLLRRPGFALVASLTLALGIGATTAIYSVVNAVLIQPLPWPNADRVVTITGMRDGQPVGVDYLDYVDWRAQNHTFDELGVLRGQSVNLTGVDTPERLFGSFTNAAMFRILGAQPQQGRLFTDNETEAGAKHPVAVLSWDFWQSHYAGSPDAVGKTIVLNGEPLVIVGVLRRGLQGPQGTPAVWMPIAYYPNKGELENRGRPSVSAIGRLKPGVPIEQARADLGAIAARIAEAYPATNAGVGVGILDLKEQLVGSSRSQLYLILAAVAVVLLITCANVANLQLTRAASRRRELTVRSALGAGRGRLMRQLVTESVLLSIIGGALGVAVAFAGTRWLGSVVPNLLTMFGSIRLNGQVLAFATVITIGTGLLFALPPAWRASRVRLNDALTTRADGGGRRAHGSVLVFGQMALCVVLLVAAGLLGRSLVAIAKVNPGFDPEHVLTMQFRLPPAKYDTDEKIASVFERMLAEVKAVPGVQSAAFVRATPLNGNGEMDPYQLDGIGPTDPKQLPMLHLNLTTPGYPETMRLPLLAGRDFTSDDRLNSTTVALVNEQLAKRIAPTGSPLGKRIGIMFGSDMRWATVVGVVGNAKHFAIAEPQLDQAYLPIAQRPLIFTEVVIRSAGDPASVATAARTAIQRVDAEQPVWGIRPLMRSIEGQLGPRQFILQLIEGFTVLAVLLAMIGIYGVTAYAVAGRTQEMGIRMALGARAGQVVRLVVGQGMKTIGAAIVVGLAASFGASKLIESQLYGVTATDPAVYALVPVVLGGVALLACWFPARRASAVDPVKTLRSE
jgi:putative ABC transport system permease protein